MRMKMLMDAATRALCQFTEQMDEKDIENIEIEHDSLRGRSRLFIDFKEDMRAIFRFSDEKMEFIHEKTINFFD